MREMRKEELKKHVETVNALLRQAAGAAWEDGGVEEHGSGGEEWAGFNDDGDEVVEAKPTSIAHEDEYIDEDRYTTVTVESIDVTKDGVQKSADVDSEEEEEEAVDGDDAVKGKRKRGDASGNGSTAKEKPSAKPKKKKKKFRYLSKLERKATRLKERSGNRAKAKARRE